MNVDSTEETNDTKIQRNSDTTSELPSEALAEASHFQLGGNNPIQIYFRRDTKIPTTPFPGCLAVA
jgi:hypothetical protein